ASKGTCHHLGAVSLFAEPTVSRRQRLCLLRSGAAARIANGGGRYRAPPPADGSIHPPRGKATGTNLRPRVAEAQRSSFATGWSLSASRPLSPWWDRGGVRRTTYIRTSAWNPCAGPRRRRPRRGARSRTVLTRPTPGRRVRTRPGNGPVERGKTRPGVGRRTARCATRRTPRWPTTSARVCPSGSASGGWPGGTTQAGTVALVSNTSAGERDGDQLTSAAVHA